LLLLPQLLLLLQARYGLVALKDENFPRYKLFKKGSDTTKPLDYKGDMKQAKELLRWTVEQTGVFIGIKVRLDVGWLGSVLTVMLQPVCSNVA
jgi:hypothetical protein